MESIIRKISELKAARNAVIMAHNYTAGEVQDIADFCGDSLELARIAANCNAPVIVLCGVRFMAETAKILSPSSIVLHPEPSAGCPMADMADPDAVKAYKKAHPDTIMVAYVNTTAATKTVVDICCTSGNAEKIISRLPENKEIMFLPDANLGSNVSGTLNRKMNLWNGCCPIHNQVSAEMILAAKNDHPGVPVLVHPECKMEVVKIADHAMSTGGMLDFVKKSPAKEFIIGTEIGILHRMRKENPGKTFYPLTPEIICADMKKITLQKIADALENLEPQIVLDEETIRAARSSIEKMLELSK